MINISKRKNSEDLLSLNNDCEGNFNMFDYSKNDIITTKDKSYNLNNVKDFIIKHFFPKKLNPNDKEFQMKMNIFSNLNLNWKNAKLNNPKVNITIIFNKSIQTKSAFIIDENEKDIKIKETIFSGGDGTVPSESILLPGLLWLYETIKFPKEFPNTIKFVDYCSVDNDGQVLYDKTYSYIGCECKRTDMNNCNHSMFLNDNNLIDYLKGLIYYNKEVNNRKNVDKLNNNSIIHSVSSKVFDHSIY